jgi:hypothetical protein
MTFGLARITIIIFICHDWIINFVILNNEIMNFYIVSQLKNVRNSCNRNVGLSADACMPNLAVKVVSITFDLTLINGIWS